MDLIDRAEMHDLIAKRLSDYLTDESRNELEELDIKVEEDIPTVQAVPIEVLDKIRAEIEELADADGYGDYQLGFSFGLMMAMEIIDKYRGSEVEDGRFN